MEMSRCKLGNYTGQTRFVMNTKEIGKLTQYDTTIGQTYNSRPFSENIYPDFSYKGALLAGTEVFITGQYSRRKLSQMFGKNAMIRGVKLV